MRSLLFLIFIFSICKLPSQKISITLTLSDVINYYSLCSPMAKIEYLNFQNEILEFANYKKGFLPAISLNVNPVNFNRSLRLLQSPVDDFNILKQGMEAAEKENLLTREHIYDIFSYIFSKTIINN